MLLDFKIKLLLARVLREQEQRIIESKQKDQIKLIHTIIKQTSTLTIRNEQADQELRNRGISATSAVFSKISSIDDLLNQILDFCM